MSSASPSDLPLDYARSPYTGWTREHWTRVLAELTYGYALAADKQGTYARALYPDDRRDLPDAVDALESFARLASAWGAWLSNPRNPTTLEYAGRTLDLADLLTRALLDGTDPANPHTYWGDMRGMDQRIVESADIAVTLYLSRERVLDRLPPAGRAQILDWLAQAGAQDVYYDNWILFPLLPMTVRHLLGENVDLADLDARLDQMAAFYRGDGWYVDGPGAEFELYNAWMFNWHYLLWAHLDGARRPAYTERLLRRARSFLSTFVHFFGANGSYPAWGRSIVYRFAAVSCFSAAHRLGLTVLSPGLLRRVSSGCIQYFVSHGAIDPAGHYLRQGFYGDFPPAAEAYISPGSPYWACHGLFGLAFSDDDPFWTAVEEPLPVERGDYDLALPTPGFVLSGRRATGQVQLLNAGSGHHPENPRHNYVPKYGKFAYSTHFPFNVLPAGRAYAPDAMLALTPDDLSYGHRFVNRAFGVGPGAMWIEFLELVDGEPQLVRVALRMWRELQLRFSFVQPTHRVRVVEAPGALGCGGAAAVTRRSDPVAGWEYAEAEGRALAIQRLVGYDAQVPSAPFLGYSNINLAYAYAEQPLLTERAPSRRARAFASAALLRPAPFDPSREFAGIHVESTPAGEFRAALPDGTALWLSLANELPASVELAHESRVHAAEGPAVRALSVGPTGFTALGVTRIAGVCELAAPGTVKLERAPGAPLRVTTDVGVTLAPEYVGGPVSSLAVAELDGSWRDLTVSGTTIPHARVLELRAQAERTLLDFQVTV